MGSSSGPIVTKEDPRHPIISSPPPSTSSTPPPPPWRSRPLSRPLHSCPRCPTSQTATFPSLSSSKTRYPLLLGSGPPSRLPSCRHRPRRHCGHPARPVLSIVVRGRASPYGNFPEGEELKKEIYRLVFDDVFEAANEDSDVGICPLWKPMTVSL